MSPRVRMWIEILLAGMATVMSIVTLIWPNWIELLFDESPDGGDGSAERAFALLWIIVALVFGWMARRDQRLLAAGSPANQ